MVFTFFPFLQHKCFSRWLAYVWPALYLSLNIKKFFSSVYVYEIVTKDSPFTFEYLVTSELRKLRGEKNSRGHAYFKSPEFTEKE